MNATPWPVACSLLESDLAKSLGMAVLPCQWVTWLVFCCWFSKENKRTREDENKKNNLCALRESILIEFEDCSVVRAVAHRFRFPDVFFFRDHYDGQHVLCRVFASLARQMMKLRSQTLHLEAYIPKTCNRAT